MKKIAVITSNRADFGPLFWLIKAIHDEPNLELQLIVSGAHLLAEYGFTINEINETGIPISFQIPYITPDNISDKSAQLSVATLKVGEALSTLKPDLLILLGDRYELLAFASAALMEGVPIAHLSGGEITAGAFDDAIRHAVTKLSYWHFVANENAANRVRQLGESPDRIFIVGDIGLEHLHKTKLLTLSELSNSLGFLIAKPLILVTFHPETWTNSSALLDQEKVLRALMYFLNGYQLIITYPNCDQHNYELIDQLKNFMFEFKEAVCLVSSLGVGRYLTALHYAEVVVGNSSSGIFEASSYKTPTVNIGERQKGRLQSKTVINVSVDDDIVAAIKDAIEMKKNPLVDWSNPYGDGNTVEKILALLLDNSRFPLGNQKNFYDL